MKRAVVLAVVLAVVFSTMAFAGPLNEKIDRLKQTNQERERTYYPRDMNPVLISVQGGPPVLLGSLISYNINEMFAVGVFGGAFMPGVVAGFDFKWYILPTTFSPYVGTGIEYVGAAMQYSLVAGHLEAGVDLALDNGFCVNLGIGYMRSFSEATGTFKTAWGDTANKVDWFMVQAGLGFRM
ncbi:MAG TPA: hypothetical protein ENN43_03780 [bacterium]|nr:hypothetical protein [bacterium]